jgi:hypothetical protein
VIFGSKHVELERRSIGEQATLSPASLCDLRPGETGVVEETVRQITLGTISRRRFVHTEPIDKSLLTRCVVLA